MNRIRTQKRTQPRGEAVRLAATLACLILASTTPAQVSGTRSLPASYVPGVTLTVDLDLTINGGPPPYGLIVQEVVPDGWTVSTSSPAYERYERWEGCLRWLFNDVDGVGSQSLSYDLVPSEVASGSGVFDGTLSFVDTGEIETTVVITGDSTLEQASPTPTATFTVTCTPTNTPTATETPTNTPSPTITPTLPFNLISGYRDLPPKYDPGLPMVARILLDTRADLAPPGAIIQESLPQGWALVASTPEVDVYDPLERRVKWLLTEQTGLADGAIHYELAVPDLEEGTRTFTGILEFTHVEAEYTLPIVGEQELSRVSVNQPPNFSYAGLVPDPADKEDTLEVVTAGWHDDEGDPEGYEYAWYVESEPVAGIAGATLTNDHFEEGETVYCETTAYDGKDRGNTLIAGPATIRRIPPVFYGLVTATAGDGSVLLEWEAGTDASPPIVYNVYEAASPGAQDFEVPSATTEAASLLLEGLVNNRAYYYVVRAEDRRGNEDGNTVERRAVPQSDDYQPVFEGRLAGVRVPGLLSGGGSYAQPAIADLDDDRDYDVLIGQENGTLTYWENAGTPQAPSWLPPVRNYAVIAVGLNAAPCVADVDRDGDLDLAIGRGDGTLVLYRNVGDGKEPGWVEDPDYFAGVSVSWFCVPALGDLDGDGDSDLVAGQFDGTLTYFERAGEGWEPGIQNYAGVDVGLNSAPQLADTNGDGVLDLLIGRSDGALTLVKNTGTIAAPAWEEPPVDGWESIAVGSMSAPALGDFNGDRRLDLLVGDEPGKVVSFLGGAGGLTAQAGNFEYLDIGARSAAATGDLDGDGDRDLLLGDADGTLTFLRNIGNALAAQWDAPLTAYQGIDVGSFSVPCLHDMNGDTRLDLVIGESAGRLRYYANTGTGASPVFTLADSQLAGLDVGTYSAPCVVDFDRDGDGDLLVGAADGTLTYVERTGASSWGAPQTHYAVLDVGTFSVPATADLDADGLPDLLVGGADGTLLACFNEGAPGAPIWGAPQALYAGIDVAGYAAPTLADLDGDGDADLLVGEAQGGLNLWRSMAYHLRLRPQGATVVEGATLAFRVEQLAPGSTLEWSLFESRSGAAPLVPSGTDGAVYQAGMAGGPGVYDVIEVRDATGEQFFARAYVNVIRAADVGTTGKVIICAGRKDETDTVWRATNYLSQLAYRMCLFKGFDKDDIYFLSPVVGQDADGNGNADDDIDAEATLANLGQAMDWAAGAPELAIYLVDHGWEYNGAGRFRINEGSENVLTAEQLGAWLDGLQESSSMTITTVIDCCNAGAFLPYVTPPPGKARIAVAACAADQLTYFGPKGLTSFSEAFWSNVYVGLDTKAAFDLAAEAMAWYQTPWLDDDGDGAYVPGTDGAVAGLRTIGFSALAGADRPQIGAVVGNQVIKGTTCELWAADISSTYAIERVWATILPPSFMLELDPSQPVIDLPSAELVYNPLLDRYEGLAEGLVEPGTYRIKFYAGDIWQSVSLPRQVYVHQWSVDERAVLVVGEDAYAPGDPLQPWSSSNYLGHYSFTTMRSRWFGKGDIRYLNPVLAQDADGNGLFDDVDEVPTLAGLEHALRVEAAGADKLTLYLVGQGSPDALKLNSSETLLAADLDDWLDDLQAGGTEVCVVLECRQSGSFMNNLLPPAGASRIVIASAAPGYESYCYSGGVFSFSQFFWNGVYEGRDLRDAFAYARPEIAFLTGYLQVPGLDDNGDGVPNQSGDGSLAAGSFVGPNLVTGGDDLPTIVAVADEIVLRGGQTSATLWCADVFDSDGILGVQARIVPPDWPAGAVVDVPMTYNEAALRFEATYASFDRPGDYRILYTARDREGNVSTDETGVVYQYGTADDYEVDDTTAEATLIVVDYPVPQLHNFHDAGDHDWVWFVAIGGETYTISAEPVAGAVCNLVLGLFDETGTLMVPPGEVDFGWAGEPETVIWTFAATGVCYVRVRDADPGAYGTDTGYELRVTTDSGATNLAAVPQSCWAMRLTWTPGGSPDLDHTVIERSEHPSWGYAEIASLPAGTTTYLDTGLDSETTYFYQVIEVETGGLRTYAVSPVFATTPVCGPVYVDPDDPEHCFETIQEGVDVAGPGMQVVIRDGVYAEQVTVPRPLTLMGSGSAILDGGGAGTGILVSSTGVTIAYLRIQNYDYGIDVGASAHAVVHHCNFVNNIQYALRNQNPGATVTAENCWWGKATGP